jgi:hypothetical protein
MLPLQRRRIDLTLRRGRSASPRRSPLWPRYDAVSGSGTLHMWCAVGLADRVQALPVFAFEAWCHRWDIALPASTSNVTRWVMSLDTLAPNTRMVAIAAIAFAYRRRRWRDITRDPHLIAFLRGLRSFETNATPPIPIVWVVMAIEACEPTFEVHETPRCWRSCSLRERCRLLFARSIDATTATKGITLSCASAIAASRSPLGALGSSWAPCTLIVAALATARCFGPPTTLATRPRGEWT